MFANVRGGNTPTWPKDLSTELERHVHTIIERFHQADTEDINNLDSIDDNKMQ